MLLHLLIYLLRKSAEKDTTSESYRVPLPARQVQDDPVMLDCPNCKALVVAAHTHFEEPRGNPRRPKWKRISEIFTCPSCQQIHIAEHYENDGTGVLRIKTWTCKSCRESRPASTTRCPKCGTWA